VAQHQSSVHKVELPEGRLIVRNVVAAHLDMGTEVASDPADIDVSNQDMSGRPDPSRQPPGYRGSAGPDFPAPPAAVDPQRLEVPESHWIEDRSQGIEALASVVCAVIQQVVARTHRASVRFRAMFETLPPPTMRRDLM
jgi:hypothetical protein